MSRESILGRCRAAIGKHYPMPDLDAICATTYPSPYDKFVEMSRSGGCKVIEAEEGFSLDALIRATYPDAKKIASNMEEVKCATVNPDTASPQELDGTDVGVIPGDFGVAENGCVWVPQTMRDKAVEFISESLVIVMKRECVVSNMHEAYARIRFNSYNFGAFISGPSKTADIAQVLVLGAQAARQVTLVLVP